MWIEKLPNGKFKYCERYEDPITGKTKKVSLTHTKKTKKVQEEMLLKLQAKINSQSSKNDNETFQKISDDWLTYYAATVKPSTALRARTHMNSLNKVIGKRTLKSLMAADFNSYILKGLQDQRFKYNTAKQLESLLIRIIKYAIKHKGINRMDIIPLIEVPNINKSEKDDMKYLEQSEIKQILDFFDKNDMHEYKRMTAIQVNTGMRFAEMISLDYAKDINFEERSIHIRRTYDFTNKIYNTPKTGNERIIYFNRSLTPIIKEQIRYDKLKVMRYGIDKDNTLLFKTQHGNPISTLMFNNALKKVGITHKKVTTHIFRHTYITLAVENKLDKDIIAKQVGHADTKMIERVYGHFTQKMEKEQKRAMSDFRII